MSCDWNLFYFFSRRITCLCSYGPASKHPSSAESNLKNDPFPVTATQLFARRCLAAILAMLCYHRACRIRKKFVFWIDETVKTWHPFELSFFFRTGHIVQTISMCHLNRQATTIEITIIFNTFSSLVASVFSLLVVSDGSWIPEEKSSCSHTSPNKVTDLTKLC